jgi:hypothetical protein
MIIPPAYSIPSIWRHYFSGLRSPLPLLGDSVYLPLYPGCYRVDYIVADSKAGSIAEVESNCRVAGPGERAPAERARLELIIGTL